MAKEAKFYYTWRKTSVASVFECVKWDAFLDEVVGTYQVFPYAHNHRGACACPAFKQCKHLKRLNEILDKGWVPKLAGLKWDEVDGWQEIGFG